jgi:hypothetical protein
MSREDKENFKLAKEILIFEEVVGYFDPKAPTRLYTDASNLHGLGFHLQQKQQDGKWKVVQYGSRTLKGPERAYPPIDLELTGLVYAVHECKVFLTGMSHFDVFTDHQPLVSICNKNKSIMDNKNLRQAKALMKLIDFNFTMHHVKGTDNCVADALSRYPSSQPSGEDEVDDMTPYIRAIQSATVGEPVFNLRVDKVRNAAATDVESGGIIRW